MVNKIVMIDNDDCDVNDDNMREDIGKLMRKEEKNSGLERKRKEKCKKKRKTEVREGERGKYTLPDENKADKSRKDKRN